MHINYQAEMDKIEKQLEKSFDNQVVIINILKEITDSGCVNLFFYDKSEKSFYDNQKNIIIPLRFLEDATVSMIGATYTRKKLYFCHYVPFDLNYNVALDNPFRLKFTSQIILPIILDNKVVGFLRFSKRGHTFSQETLDIVKELTAVLHRFFLYQIGHNKNELFEEFYTLTKTEVHNSINTIKNELNRLLTHTHNPEILKLINNATMHVESVNTYISTANIIDTSIIAPKKTDNIRILIADDVKMNVRILHAMIKQEKITDICFAYDGIETLEKIKQAYNDNNHIDILFLDHYMPGKLGLEVAQHIREYERLHNKSRLFVVSITNDPKAIEEQRNLYDFHIPKPFVKSDILEVLKEIHILQTN